jgi:hypothetical protein
MCHHPFASQKMIFGYVKWEAGSSGVQVIVVSRELMEQVSPLRSHHPERKQLDDFRVQDLEVPGYLKRFDEPEDPFW